jgi:hypothetical protein
VSDDPVKDQHDHKDHPVQNKGMHRWLYGITEQYREERGPKLDQPMMWDLAVVTQVTMATTIRFLTRVNR